MITSLLDPEEAPACELAALCPQRWEIELAIKEGRQVFRAGRITLRSRTPELVMQEFWGLLLAYYIVRGMMARAALDGDIDPDVPSYKSSVEIIRSNQAAPVLAFPPWAKNEPRGGFDQGNRTAKGIHESVQIERAEHQGKTPAKIRAATAWFKSPGEEDHL